LPSFNLAISDWNCASSLINRAAKTSYTLHAQNKYENNCISFSNSNTILSLKKKYFKNISNTTYTIMKLCFVDLQRIQQLGINIVYDYAYKLHTCWSDAYYS